MIGARSVAVLVAGTCTLSTASCAADVPRPVASPSTGAPSASAPASPGRTPSRVPSARRATSAVVAEAPVRATLPGGRRVPVRAVTTTPSGLLDVPDDIDVAGWWRGGAQLGDPFGATLVAAHVDSRTQGLGPFAELLTVAPGARLRLDSAHLSQTFEVRSRRLVPQGSLDRETWLFEAGGPRRLLLVTCAPPYDAARGGYQNLAVITAVPASPVRR